MGSGTLRLAVIAVLVVLGVFILTKGFPATTVPSTPVSTNTPPNHHHHHKPRATPTPSATTNPGTEVAVFNGTTQLGLAKTAADALTRAGYVVPKTLIGNAPTQTVGTTTIYFRKAQGQAAAQALANGPVFQGIQPDVTQLPSTVTNVPKSVPLAVYLGTDYAAKNHP